ncbi:MBL fold metallo-hydrolase [Alkalicoccus halolimnae]|uniref:MBL fold metallo-hydrolase n=1 Tax=Alkalicoccus halolimnae TaxID=1667239 RepID=A0A5C7F6W7_9BACI|nr:MBL fold metallo-hydrolase [Alkalicoccus halolimnae]TXF85148.1 MBL fold metallo-hydrolase [Alkalicoccus halolimnae]
MQELIHLNDHLVYMTPVEETDRPILAAVTGRNRTLMIDAGNSEAHARLFLDQLTGAGITAPSLVALTHWHWDHVFGLSALTRMPSIATEATKQAMKKIQHFTWDDQALNERVQEGTEIEFCADAIKKEFPEKRDINVSLPTITFEKEVAVDLGEVTCLLKKVGGDHSPDGLIVYIREEKTMFLADALAPDLYAPSWRFTSDRTIAMLDEIEAFDADTYIISHWKPISKKEFQEEADLLRSTAELIKKWNGDEGKVRAGMEKKYGTPLSEEEELALTYFLNGRV